VLPPEAEHVGPTLLDQLEELTEARRRRDEGQRVALNAADVRWTSAAAAAIRDLCATRDRWTAEDLRERVGHLASSPNALGAAISAAAKRGEIVCVGAEPATRPEAHARLLRVWSRAGGA
jgi:hypothetical protein